MLASIEGIEMSSMRTILAYNIHIYLPCTYLEARDGLLTEDYQVTNRNSPHKK